MVAHYGQKFDRRYLNTRFMAAGYHGGLPPYPLFDTCLQARRFLKLRSNRLWNIANFFKLDQKTVLDWEDWKKAQHGNKAAMRQVALHCRQDIVTLEQVYILLRGVTHLHFNVGVMEGAKDDKMCRNCGSTSLRRHSHSHHTTANRYPLYHCRKCGAWVRGRNALQGTELR